MTLDEDALEAAADSVIDAAFGQELPEAPIDLARAAVTAYLEHLPVEYAGKHKHAGIELTDEDGEPFSDEGHVRSNYADYGNCTIVARRVTDWEPLDKEAKS